MDEQGEIKLKLYKIFLAVFMIGIVITFVGILKPKTFSYSEAIYSLTSHIGVAFIAAALVGLFFEKVLLEYAMLQVRSKIDEVTQEIEKQTDIMVEASKKFEILKVASEAGIKAIYISREKADEYVKNKLSVDELVKKAEDLKQEFAEVDLLGVCLRDFFKGDGRLTSYMSKFHREIVEKEIKKVRIRVLPLYPYTVAAINRMKAEESQNGPFVRFSGKGGSAAYKLAEARKQLPNTSFYNDCRSSLRTLYNLNRELPEIFHVRYCVSNPMVHLLRFNDEIFVEPYHLGKAKKYLGRRCLGGLVPAWHLVKNETSSFESFKNHFEYLWWQSEKINICKIVNVQESSVELKNELIDFLPPEKLQADLLEIIAEFCPKNQASSTT